jgi:D-sedoheptulose 7-phosphate isomerase
MQSLLAQQAVFEKIAAAVVQTLRAGGKILSCGNGGSAADAMHLAEELVGRYRSNRRSLPGICLTADATALTCIANDFGFDEVLPAEGLGAKGDLLVCLNERQLPNILRAFDVAVAPREDGLCSVRAAATKRRADFELIVGSDDTARVQEAHTLILCVA